MFAKYLISPLHRLGCPSKDSDPEVEDGMLLITQQVWFKRISRSRAKSHAPLEERDVDVRVKRWLIGGGATEDKLEWLSIWDTIGLTIDGCQPSENDEHGLRPIELDMTDVPWAMHMAWIAQGRPDVRGFFGDEVYEMMTANSPRR